MFKSQRSAFLHFFGSPRSGCAQPWLRKLIRLRDQLGAIHPWIAVEI